MLNYIWLALVLAAVLIGGCTDHLREVSDQAFKSAKAAVLDTALPLIGVTALWLGLMRLAERAGMTRILARALRPLLSRLFPDVPAQHPAMGAMLMNFAANMIGLTNAATPLGLRAMTDLEKLNPRPGTATNAMCTFLAINTSSLQLIPTGAIAILAASGSAHPTAIIGTSLLATLCSMTVGITSVKLLERLPLFRLEGAPSDPASLAHAQTTGEQALPDPAVPPTAPSRWALPAVLALVAFFAFLFLRAMQHDAGTSFFPRAVNALSDLAIPFMLVFFPLYATFCGVRVYEEFVEGAREGFQVAVRIIPFLVAMLVAIGIFRAAGGVALLAQLLKPVLDLIQFPTELLPMAITRPLSGSATIGLLADLAKAHGPDSLLARTGGTILGSTETTLYVVAVYFGAVSVKRARHAILAGLLADLTGILSSVLICRWVFGG